MKKKLFLSILGLFIFTVCLVRVNAANKIFDIGWDLVAVAPSTQPDSNKTYYGTTTNLFDFSKVIFADNNGNDLPGMLFLKKILVGDIKSISANPTGTITSANIGDVFNNYFTAYCLDEGLKYPEFGLFNLRDYYMSIFHSGANAGHYDDTNGTTPAEVAIAIANIMNNDYYSHMLNDLKTEFAGEGFDYISDYEGAYSPVSIIAPYEGETGHENDSVENFIHYFMGESGYSAVTVGLRYIGFYSQDPINPRYVYYVADTDTYDEITSNYGGPNVKVKYITGSSVSQGYTPLTGTLATLALQKLTFTRNVSSAYTHALWIIENSYPTLSLDTSLSKAGVNIDTFKAQVKALYNLADSDVDKYTEMVTYGIVQYAIWKVTGTSVEGTALGTSIKGTGSTELNKLYQYLINKTVPANYANASVFSNKLTITAPQAGKELYKKTENYDIYGPFTASYNAINETGSKIQYTIANNTNNDIKIVNGASQELSQLDNGQEFYIQVNNKADINNASISLSINGITTFYPSTNRAVIFNPVATTGQNVLIGGRTSTMALNGSIEIEMVTNPNTGIQNIALLLVVTLVAFALGYLALSYKQKPIQMNQ